MQNTSDHMQRQVTNMQTLTSVITKTHRSSPTTIKMLNACGVSPTPQFQVLHNALQGLFLIRNAFMPDDVEGIVSAINEKCETPEICVSIKP